MTGLKEVSIPTYGRKPLIKLNANTHNSKREIQTPQYGNCLQQMLCVRYGLFIWSLAYIWSHWTGGSGLNSNKVQFLYKLKYKIGVQVNLVKIHVDHRLRIVAIHQIHSLVLYYNRNI